MPVKNRQSVSMPSDPAAGCQVASGRQAGEEPRGIGVAGAGGVHNLGRLGGDRYRLGAAPANVVDTTGAGDAYAAGFLAGLTAGRDLAACGRIASIAAAEIIGHYGARPQADLRALTAGV